MVALIMAGGLGKRMGGKIEKPLVKILGKPMISWVIDAAVSAKKISEVCVAVTDQTPKTLEEVSKAPVKVIKTDGKGYHLDLQQAILSSNLNCPVLTLSADLPLLTAGFLDEVISHYWEAGKPALMVLVPLEASRKHGAEPTSLYPFEGKNYAVAGVNIVDGRKILELEQEQEVLISDRVDVSINVNTRQDLEAAEKYLRDRSV